MVSDRNKVHIPSPEDAKQAEESSRTLAKYTNADRVKLSIRASNGESDDLILPGDVLQILLDVMSEIGKGNAISLVPHHQELGTQEAANLLNVSRPHLVSLLENGEIPFRKVGSHRRVLLTDVLSYRQSQHDMRSDTLDELAALSQQKNMGY